MELAMKEKQHRKIFEQEQQKRHYISDKKSIACKNRSSNIRDVKGAGVVQRIPDPVEHIVMEEEIAQVKVDVDNAMTRLRDEVLENEVMVHRLRGRTGRDAWVYAGFFERSQSLLQILNSWSQQWTIENTCGLLLDLGLALRNLCEEMIIMNGELNNGRVHGEHRVDRESDWALQDVPAGAAMQAGPSATSGQLLRLLHHFRNQINIREIEAIMIGVVKYWKDGSFIKRLLGHYHTAVEVWSVYMYYLEENNRP